MSYPIIKGGKFRVGRKKGWERVGKDSKELMRRGDRGWVIESEGLRNLDVSYKSTNLGWYVGKTRGLE